MERFGFDPDDRPLDEQINALDPDNFGLRLNDIDEKEYDFQNVPNDDNELFHEELRPAHNQDLFNFDPNNDNPFIPDDFGLRLNYIDEKEYDFQNVPDDDNELFHEELRPAPIPAHIPLPAPDAPIPARLPPAAPVAAIVARKISPTILYNIYRHVADNKQVDLNVLTAVKPCTGQLREKCKRNYYIQNYHRPNFDNIKCISKSCLLQICKELGIKPYSANRYSTADKNDLLTSIIDSQITSNPFIWCSIHKHKDNILTLLRNRNNDATIADRVITTICNIHYNRAPTVEDIPFITKITKNIIKLSNHTITEVAKYIIAVSFPTNTNVYTFAHRLTTSNTSAAIISNTTLHEKISRSKSRIVTIISINPLKVTLLNSTTNKLYILQTEAIADTSYQHNHLFIQTLNHFTSARNHNVFEKHVMQIPIGLNHIYITLIYYFVKTGLIPNDIFAKISEQLRSANPQYNTRELLGLSNFLTNTYLTA